MWWEVKDRCFHITLKVDNVLDICWLQSCHMYSKSYKNNRCIRTTLTNRYIRRNFVKKRFRYGTNMCEWNPKKLGDLFALATVSISDPFFAGSKLFLKQYQNVQVISSRCFTLIVSKHRPVFLTIFLGAHTPQLSKQCAGISFDELRSINDIHFFHLYSQILQIWLSLMCFCAINYLYITDKNTMSNYYLLFRFTLQYILY